MIEYASVSTRSNLVAYFLLLLAHRWDTKWRRVWPFALRPSHLPPSSVRQVLPYLAPTPVSPTCDCIIFKVPPRVFPPSGGAALFCRRDLFREFGTAVAPRTRGRIDRRAGFGCGRCRRLERSQGRLRRGQACGKADGRRPTADGGGILPAASMGRPWAVAADEGVSMSL